MTAYLIRFTVIDYSQTADVDFRFQVGVGTHTEMSTTHSFIGSVRVTQARKFVDNSSGQAKSGTSTEKTTPPNRWSKSH